MLVKNFMQKNPIFMREDQPVRDAARFIFNLGISGVLVCKGKKLTGIITEIDILQRLFPSIKDFMEDQIHALDAEGFMEDKFSAIINRPVSEYMTKQVKTIQANSPVMRALSLMLVNEFTHVPVVNKKGELEGIISQGDIFKAIVGMEIPYDDEIEYHNWISYHFDFISHSLGRYTAEIESLDKEFKKRKIESVIDIGCGTGSHAVMLASKHYHVVGIDRSKYMYNKALSKWKDLSGKQKPLVQFKHIVVPYEEELNTSNTTYNAAVFMGNMLAHMPDSYEKVLRAVSEHTLSKKDGTIVLQLTNTERMFENNRRLRSFSSSKSKLSENREYAFMEFYDPPRTKGGHLTLSMSVLTYNGRRWMQSGMNSTAIAYIPKVVITKLLKKFGFTNISFFGSLYGEPLFKKKFDVDNDDWLNIVATR